MTGPTYPLAVAKSVAEPIVLIDPATGEAYAAGAVVGGALDSTLLAVEALLATPATALPPTPLMAPGDLTGSVVIDFNTSGEHSIAPLLAANYSRVYRIHFTCAAAVVIEFYDCLAAEGTPALIDGFIAGGAGDGIDLVLDGRAHMKSQLGKSIVMKILTAGVRVLGRSSYLQSTT